MNQDFEQAKQQFVEGLRCFEAGRYEQADEHFRSSLALLPGRPSTLTNLAATRLKLQRPQEALEIVEQALAAAPDDVDAWALRGMALVALQRQGDALEAFDRALAIDPSLAPAWSNRGAILKDMHRIPEAIVSFEKAIALGADPEVNGWLLASLTGARAPVVAPSRYVERLFDDYADSFDDHLVSVLRYQAHVALVAGLPHIAGRRHARALDLGCGTGLCGPLLQPLAGRIDGVDLSGRMLDKARTRGVYDELAQADVVQYLQSTAGRYDLVVAADVFIYIGDLDAVFAGVHRVMDAGVFCFSVEALDDGRDFALRSSQRYAHSEGYLRALAKRHGFDVAQVLQRTLREDQREPITGLLVYLTIG
ncbi:tetratricopeptide repeat protein [Piscinibacter sp. XHJ-5]|uniref:tetratricopeptide repeat protein n=1 Tax=Piscinibacter sp. XHJ-5 TaxID=3037797 RepID=UPI0024534FD8|nr:tetratricopeptide repeat protein [Piscinibacter sp. XHJ-5]